MGQTTGTQSASTVEANPGAIFLVKLLLFEQSRRTTETGASARTYPGMCNVVVVVVNAPVALAKGHQRRKRSPDLQVLVEDASEWPNLLRRHKKHHRYLCKHVGR